MRKVMLVDDEYMLLRGLKRLIDWSALGLEIVTTEQNPLLAIKYLQTNPIDILISDMNMPEMGGPEFVTKAKQLQPQLELIVISGYSDFDYVHAGLKQNAVNYLRKPIDTDELLETLQGAIARLEARQESDHNASLAVQTQSRTLLTSDDVIRQARMSEVLGLQFTEAKPVRLIGVLNPLPPRDLVNYLKVLAAIKGFYVEGQDFIIIFQGTAEQLNVFINEAPHQIGAERRPFLVGAPVKHLTELAQRYQQLRQEIARQYFFETAAGLRVMLPETQQQSTQVLPSYSEVKGMIDNLSVVDFSTWLTTQLEDMKAANASDSYARQFALVVLLVLSDHLTAFNDKTATIAAINRSQDMSALKTTLLRIANLAKQTGVPQFSRNVAAMRQLVQKRFAEPLTLGIVAAELHLNAVYLGQQFKQEVGRSFSQYLNDYRVNVAVDLLRRSDQDVGQIAELVGYQNSSYFFKLFKLQTGMSPGEYRKAGTMDV
ncbi:response regulator [Lactiplantibacillus sp. WILCCON 0030]|uniref:Response regulator n=1 Tax=Lactiplantibacillus brownii TaxID=3069269 RepID=A0ABU1ACP6_9LACO|nr:response regulator [Lactiplantibacillus brownii]MDQ7938695.1 response regulator [Lactiplantibacillus brownii]